MNEEMTRELLATLKAIAGSNPPGWQRPLKTYSQFDWSKIGATVISRDNFGATAVSWCGHIYTRRSGENRKFGAAIWFSRPNGTDESGETAYARLITFKQLPKAEPLPEYVAAALQ